MDSAGMGLRNKQIQATYSSSAALLGDGSEVTWGHPEHGSDSSGVQDKLRNVHQIHAADNEFAVILGDGSAVTWGRTNAICGSSCVKDQLKHVRQIQASAGIRRYPARWISFDLGKSCLRRGQQQRPGSPTKRAADPGYKTRICCHSGHGSVVTWGRSDFGGDTSEVQRELRNVLQIQAADYAFPASRSDGGVVTWGTPNAGGDSCDVQDQLRNVQQIQAADRVFAAILCDGSVVCWGAHRGRGVRR